MQNKCLKLFFLLLCILVFAGPAWSDAGLAPLMFLAVALPSLLVQISFGLSLLIIIAVEAPILRARCALKPLRAYALTAWANVFSTIIGILIILVDDPIFFIHPADRDFLRTWSDEYRTGETIVRISLLIIGSLLFAMMYRSFGLKAGFLWRKAPQGFLSRVMEWGGFLIFPICWLMTHTGYIKVLHYVLPFLRGGVIGFVSLSILSLFAGFIMTIVAEGFIIAQRLPEKQPKVVSTVILMNVISYVLLIVLFILSFLIFPPRFG